MRFTSQACVRCRRSISLQHRCYQTELYQKIFLSAASLYQSSLLTSSHVTPYVFHFGMSPTRFDMYRQARSHENELLAKYIHEDKMEITHEEHSFGRRDNIINNIAVGVGLWCIVFHLNALQLTR